MGGDRGSNGKMKRHFKFPVAGPHCHLIHAASARTVDDFGRLSLEWSVENCGRDNDELAIQ